MTAAAKVWTVDEIKTADANRGGFFFSPNTMRGFESRVGETVYQGSGGVFFVTSERGRGTGWDTGRRYTVRQFDPIPDGFGIRTAGPHMKLTRSGAVALAKRLAKGEITPDQAKAEYE